MDYKDYIKSEYCVVYEQERVYLEDRLLESKYNLLFLKMLYERGEAYRKNHGITERYGIRIIIRRIYITVAWELALQIKAITDDNDSDSLTINKFKNNIFRYIKTEKKQEYYNSLGLITKTPDWSRCERLVSSISDYRNQIVGHNIVNAPKLKFDIEDADFVIAQYERVFYVLCFQNEKYTQRAMDLDNEMTSFITDYLDALLPLN